jgi:hypothetical protein
MFLVAVCLFGIVAPAMAEPGTQIREAEDFNYGGGQYPGFQNCPAAVEAPEPNFFGTVPEYDYLFQGSGGPRPNAYRPNDNIDVREISPGQFIMGYTSVGDWWRYTFDVPEAGWVKIWLKVACPNGGKVHLYWDEQLVGSITYVTGNWDTYRWFPVEDQIQTATGEHTLRLYLASGQLAFDTIQMGFDWTPPKREDIFMDDFEEYTNLYSPNDLIDPFIGYEYTVVNGGGEPLGAWRLWNTAGEDLGNELPYINAMTNNYVITDSDLAGNIDVDEELITPKIDCTDHVKVRLDFNMNYKVYTDDTNHFQIAEVDIRSSDDGITFGRWVKLFHYDRTTVAEFETGAKQVDISAYADGKFIQIRCHFYEANFDYWFAVDDIRVSGEKAIDIGLRVYDGSATIKIACEKGDANSPLRIAKNGVVYGIVLVDPSDAHASGIRIQTISGVKALRKL